MKTVSNASKIGLQLAVILMLVVALLPQASATAAPLAAASPLTPKAAITDTTPTFTWTMEPGATAYQFQVWRSSVLEYTKAVTSAACSGSTCSNTPVNVLTYERFVWRVRAKIGGVWQGWSAFKAFRVEHGGFENGFGAVATGWTIFNGPWSVGSGMYSSEGDSGNWSSVYRADETYATLTYEVRMRRSACPGCSSPSAILFRGQPDPAGGSFTWNRALTFSYTNSGQFYIGVWGSPAFYYLVYWTPSSAIVPNGFNKLKVTANGDYMEFYINGIKVADGTFEAFSSGFVGIQFNDDLGRLDVDYANLDVTAPAADASTASDSSVIHFDGPAENQSGSPLQSP